METLKAHMTTTNITTEANMEFHEGTLNGTPVVIVRSGVGKVNAALCVQILADLFQVTAIINTGVAGSLNAALDIGDILISKDALHHDVDATIFGYKPGEVPSWDVGNSLQMSILSRLLPAPVRRSIRTFTFIPGV